MKTNEWWAPLRKGLFADPTGKHYQRMGPALWLYGYLHAGADWKTGKLERKYETIHFETGISIRNLQRMMNQLKKFRYVEVTRKAQSMVIQITKWRPITSANNGGSQKVIRHICPSDPPHLTSTANNGVSLKGYKQKVKPSTSANNGGSNESLYLNPNIYRVFELWNSLKIIQHREFEKFKSCIETKLKNYSEEEITRAMKNLKFILDSRDHYYSHKWTLDKFLTRKGVLDQFLNLDAAMVSFAKNSNGNGHRSQAEINSASTGKVVL
ncbi:MAG: hypothetical protein IIB46_03690 [Nitrospinae bacterium]|nr:hypothetical protein [Nitrospinota bacterium]